jgi:predicted ATPase
VDWSHALLTETERVVFRRLAADRRRLRPRGGAGGGGRRGPAA